MDDVDKNVNYALKYDIYNFEYKYDMAQFS